MKIKYSVGSAFGGKMTLGELRRFLEELPSAVPDSAFVSGNRSAGHGGILCNITVETDSGPVAHNPFEADVF